MIIRNGDESEVDRKPGMARNEVMNDADRRWFESYHLVTFGDTNVAGNVYFAQFFHWQGKCREALLAEFYPEFVEDLRRGFGMVTEFAHNDFLSEAALFDELRIRITVIALTRSRIEFAFEFLRERDGTLLSRGRQAVVWTNPQHRPSLMPEALYRVTADYFGFTEQ